MTATKKEVLAKSLVQDVPYALVGESDNLSVVTGEIYPSNLLHDFVVVETEHGSVYVDQFETVSVLYQEDQ